jgi:hypothetical protein
MERENVLDLYFNDITVEQKKEDGIWCMTNHGFGVKADDQILREENRPVSLFIAIREKMEKEERKAVSKTSYRYGSVLYCLYIKYTK